MRNTFQKLKVIHKEKPRKSQSSRFNIIFHIFLNHSKLINNLIKDLTSILLDKQIVVNITVLDRILVYRYDVFLMRKEMMEIFR